MIVVLILFFPWNSEQYNDIPQENKAPDQSSGQPRHSKARNRIRSRRVSDDRTGDTKDRERPGAVVKKSSSVTRLTSGVPRMRQAQREQREDMIPIVTYDGVVEETRAESTRDNTQAHREVKVIVHRTSSSSSSTVSSVRSVDQRTITSRGKHLRSHDPARQGHQNKTENTESEIREPEPQSTASCSIQERLHREESIELQVRDVAIDTTNSKQFCETSQETVQEGGSLAAMFDS